MNCLEAQSNIMAFIEKKLPDDKAYDFVRHIKHCKNCSEELEIYYTLVVGMHQLDNNEELSNNFKRDLDGELDRIENREKKVKGFKFSTFGVCFALAVVFMFTLYSSCLDKAYNIEQTIKADRQGVAYFYQSFHNNVDIENKDIIVRQREKYTQKEMTFFDKIKIYNMTKSEESE